MLIRAASLLVAVAVLTAAYTPKHHHADRQARKEMRKKLREQRKSADNTTKKVARAWDATCTTAHTDWLGSKDVQKKGIWNFICGNKEAVDCPLAQGVCYSSVVALWVAKGHVSSKCALHYSQSVEDDPLSRKRAFAKATRTRLSTVDEFNDLPTDGTIALLWCQGKGKGKAKCSQNDDEESLPWTYHVNVLGMDGDKRVGVASNQNVAVGCGFPGDNCPSKNPGGSAITYAELNNLATNDDGYFIGPKDDSDEMQLAYVTNDAFKTAAGCDDLDE